MIPGGWRRHVAKKREKKSENLKGNGQLLSEMDVNREGANCCNCLFRGTFVDGEKAHAIGDYPKDIEILTLCICGDMESDLTQSGDITMQSKAKTHEKLG